MNPRGLGARLTRARKRAITAFMSVVGSLILVAALVTPAHAGGNTYVWNDYTGWVGGYGVPSTNANVWYWAKNGSRFWMRCWLDNQGQRWFLGNFKDYGPVWVQARWTIDQKKVPAYPNCPL